MDAFSATKGIGVIEQVGTGVSEFHVGDKVIISCVTACLKCDFCKRGMYSHCRHGGWILGNTIDGTQAEYVRIPHADGSLYNFPAGGDEEAMVMLSDILPTGFECGVLNGQVKPGDTVAIVGAGPVGLAVLLTAQFYSPAAIFMIDLDDKRLAVAKKFGATTLINSADGHAAHHVMELTEGAGVDVAIEAVGIPATFDICQAIVAAGGRIANVGVHGKPVELHMEKLWDRNISLTTRLVDTVTTPMLLKVVRSGKLQPEQARHSSLRDERHHEGVRHVWKRGKRGRAQGGSDESRPSLKRSREGRRARKRTLRRRSPAEHQ